MVIRKNKQHIVGLVFKTIILIGIYIAFSLYTLPVYKTVRAFVEERLLNQNKVIILGESALTVEVADSQQERIQGLSGRDSLPANGGMFFIFDKEDSHGIWMKDMKFSLDILWFNKYGEIVFIKQNAKPESYPETFASPVASMYVLEVPAGFVKEKNIKLGDKIDFY